MTAATQSAESTALARIGLRLSDCFEKWFPYAFVLALAAVVFIGYSMLQFVVQVPLVLFLVWILNYTLTCSPPVPQSLP